MTISSSPDITLLEASVAWDIAGTLPIITLTNQSAGPNLAGCIFWIIAKSPSQTLIHEGSQLSPDITGDWTTFNVTDNWPRPLNQIEFSGAPYSLSLYVSDSIGNIYSITKQATICRPSGNTQLSKNPYGLATTKLQVKCEQARIFFQDTTNHVYRGLDGTRLTSTLKVVFPIDETGNIPAPFVATNFSTALVPISYSSDNYQYMQDTVYDYEFDNLVHVIIRYQSRSKNGASAIRFPVLCNIDLCPLVCEVTKLVDSIENGTCADAEDAHRKLSLINPKLLLAQIGKQEPLCGIDVPDLIEEIKAIGGFACDCCNAPTGIIPNTAAIIDGYSFSINPVCGDVTGDVTVNGTNIQFNLSDVSYVFEVDTDSPQDITAFSVVPEMDGCQKTYKLRVDGNTLGEELANIILNDGNLLNLWNTIVQGNVAFQLTVDGGCIFQSSSTCDYTFTLLNIPVNTTFALLNNIKIGSTNISISYLFNLTNLPGLQAYLNGLGLGTFVVTNPSGQTVVITSTANGEDIQGLSYKISGTTFPADMTRNCTGYVAIDANEVVQMLINYMCDLQDDQIITSQAYSVCYVDPVTKLKVTTVVPAGTALSSLLSTITTGECNTATRVAAIADVSCAAIQAVFPQSPNVMGAADYFLGTKGGACARIFPVEAGTRILSMGYFDQGFVNAFCALVALCGGGQPCAPYTIFQVEVVSFDADCPTIINFNYLTDVGGSNIFITKIIFGNTPTAAQTITVEYKLQSDSTYILLTSSASIATDGTPVASITIPTSPGQTYDIRLSNNCSSPTEYLIGAITTPGTPSDNLTIFNNTVGAGAIIDRVGFGGFGSGDLVIDGPINEGDSITGVHPAFTGVIMVDVTSPNPLTGVLRMLINMVQVDCVDATSTNTYSFSSQTILSTDDLRIFLSDDGPC